MKGGGGGGALYTAIFVHHSAINFLCQLATLLALMSPFLCVLYHKVALLQMNACHVPTTTIFLEDLYRANTVCAARIVVAGTSKCGTFGFERGRSKLEGGCRATVYRFGENPGTSGNIPRKYYNKIKKIICPMNHRVEAMHRETMSQ